MGIHSLPARNWGRIALVALLGLTLALAYTVSADASSWHRVGAETAKKKKCKKKGKKSAAAAKKKKCKKKKAPPAVTPPRGPIDRILISWSGAADFDAHAWSNGLHDGWNQVIGDYEVQIPGTTYTNSASTPNQEKVVEVNPNPSIRPMTFGICYYAGLGGVDDGPTDVTVTSVFSSGQSSTQTVNADFGDALVNTNEEGGAPDPVDEWCPEPL